MFASSSGHAAPVRNRYVGVVTAVARILPRHWDGQRLLRFLTGLALLALAFLPQPGAAVPVGAPAAPASAVTTPGVTAEPADPAPETAPSAPVRAVQVWIAALAVLAVLVVAVPLPVWAPVFRPATGSRAPPAA
jgi:hypothetical protein